jgi:hypothetical protein
MGVGTESMNSDLLGTTPDQKVRSSRDCQRRRRTEYHRKRLVEDAAYREQCRDRQQKWREKNPHYMQRYWADRRSGDRLNTKQSL